MHVGAKIIVENIEIIFASFTDETGSKEEQEYGEKRGENEKERA